MALTVAEQQTAASNTGAITFTLAAGSAVGDLLVVIFANDFDTLADLTTPTGTAATTWTLRDSFDGGSNLSHIKTFTAPVTTAGAQTVVCTATNANNEHGAVLVRIPGAVYDTSGHNNGATSTSHVAPSLTPSSNDAIYVCLWTGNDAGGGIYNYTYPASPFVAGTERDLDTFSTFGFGYEPITSGAATGTRTATASVTHAWCAAAVMVKAAASTTPDPGPFGFCPPGLFNGPNSFPQAWAGANNVAAGPITITAVGSLVTHNNQPAVTSETVSVNPTAVGNLLAVAIETKYPAGHSFGTTSVSGGGVTTWNQALAFSSVDGIHRVELWWGVATSTGASNLVVGYNPDATTQADGTSATSVDVQQFSAPGATWGVDVTGSNDTNVAGTNPPFPTLTPTSGTECYFGYLAIPGSVTAGSTPGCVYQADVRGNETVYNVAVTSTITPNTTSSSQVSVAAAMLLTTAASPPVFANDTGAAFTVVGQDAQASILGTDGGSSLAIAAQDSTPAVAASDAGATFGVAGQDATVTISGSDTGSSFTLSAQDATVTVGTNVNPAEAALTVTGQDTTSLVSPTDTGAALSVASQNAATSLLVPDTGSSFSVAGQDATVAVAISAPAGNASFSAAGQDANASVGASAGNAAASVASQDLVNPPGEVFDLSNFKITIPLDQDSSGAADEITQPTLSSYILPTYFVTDSSRRMVMNAPVTGATTSGSTGVRTELREMESGAEAAWDMATTNRSLTVSGFYDPTSITGGTTPRNEMIIGQIHATGGTPPIYITVQTDVVPTRMRVFKDGPGVGNLVTGFTTTDRLAYKIEIVGGNVNIYGCIGDETNLPGTPQFSYASTAFAESTNCYLKAGAYNKTDVSSGSTGASIATIAYLRLVQGNSVVANAQTATFSAAAQDAGNSDLVPDTGSSFSVAAQDATPGVGALDTGAGLTVSAGDTTSLVSGSDTGSAFTLAAGDATVSISGATNVFPAEGALTVASQDANTSVKASDTGATFGVVAGDSPITVGGLDTGPALSVAGQTTTSTVSTVDGGNPFSVSALDAVASTGSNTFAPADVALVSAAAGDTNSLVSPTPSESTLTTAGQDTTVTASSNVSAQTATFAATAQDALAAVAILALAIEATLSVGGQNASGRVDVSTLLALLVLASVSPDIQVPAATGTMAGASFEPYRMTGSAQAAYVMTDARTGGYVMTRSDSSDARLTGGVG